jgi:mono/diheme cytochrome c family protein
VNILKAGSNYGWPNVAGMPDNKAYEYARWAEATTPCAQLRFTDVAIHPSVPREAESAFTKPFVPPIATMFTVPSDYNFQNPVCGGIDFVCWPTVGASSIEYYASKGTGIPGWDKVLLVTTLKRGSLYVLPLSADGQKAAGKFSRYFQSENRYRDTAVSADGKTIYIATDNGGLTEAMAGGATRTVQNPGAILAFTYDTEGPAGTTDEPVRPQVTSAPAPATGSGSASGKPPAYTAQQAAAGRKQYDANCAVCHGSTMTNGTFGTPLAGEYFRNAWTGKTVRALLEKARTMPPAAPNSLPAETYTNVVAYILEVNGFKAGSTPLAAESLEGQVIR